MERRIRFERHASQVIFDPASSSFVVTWAKCGRPPSERLTSVKDPLRWLPSVDSIATLYDRGCIPQSQTVYAARAVGRAFDAGDREMLDTEKARDAASLVRDISCICESSPFPVSQRSQIDIGQAMRSLLDEIAAVRFIETPLAYMDDASVIPVMEKAAAECFAIADFVSWPHPSMRRKFMFCLNRRERTNVIYSLVSLAFDVGACPLLSISDRRTLRLRAAFASGLSDSMSEETLVKFFREALSMMRQARTAGSPRVCCDVNQQQFAESVYSSI